MKKISVSIFLINIVLYSGNFINLSITSPDYRIREKNGVHYIITDDFDHILEPGAPRLPICKEIIALPEGAYNVRLSSVKFQTEPLPGVYSIPPVQKPVILSNLNYSPPEKAFKNSIIYNSSRPYPEDIIKITRSGKMRKNKTCGIVYAPFQWIPSTGRLLHHKRIDIEISYQIKSGPGYNNSPTEVDKNIDDKFFFNTPIPKTGKRAEDDIDYLIITDSSFTDEFSDLLKWKNNKGLRTGIITTDSIYSNYPGSDNQEKIRNCIKDLYQNNNLTWVLLGGDTDIIPARITYAMTADWGISNEDSIRADLYYSDLDGSWNYDGSPPYGEVEDSVDLYPDVFVGRAPVNTEVEVTNFSQKIITYEKEPPSGFAEKLLFLGEILWSDPYTDAGIGKNIIDSLYIPDYINITKLYESLGNEDSASVVTAINEGQNMINHNGHAWYTVMGIGNGNLYRSDMDAFINGDSLGIIYSIGCWANAFEFNAISEHYINNPNGGGVAFIGNSRYGWGSPGNPGFGYSDRFDAAFYKYIYSKNYLNIGLALAASKAEYIPRSRQENVYRWHQYQLNLLGDPEMPVWPGEPDTMNLVIPDTIRGSSQFTIRITDKSSTPVKDGRICISQINGDSIWESSNTDEFGEVSFNINYNQSGLLLTTATEFGFRPAQDTIVIQPTGPFLGVTETSIEDSTGNGDGIINPGEEIFYSVDLKNTGTEDIHGFSIYLRTIDSLIEITDSACISDDTLNPSDSANYIFTFKVDSSITSSHPVNFDISCYSGGSHWLNPVSEMIGTPEFKIETTGWDIYGTDSIPSSGDSLSFHYRVKNIGRGIGYSINTVFSTHSSNLILYDTLLQIDTLNIDESRQGSLQVKISSSTPEPSIAWIINSTGTINNFTAQDSTLLKIGETGFFDDMEAGDSRWEHFGSNDHWHLSSFRKNSGDSSFYCGDENTHQYVNSMEAVLRTEPFPVFAPCTLSFYHWYEYTNYGNDGLYVIVEHDTEMDTLDYIGSGGALDSTLNIGNPWLEDRYDLSWLEQGTMVRINFVFKTDNSDLAEGIYIDDVRVTGSYLPLSGIEIPEETSMETISSIIHSAYGWVVLKLNQPRKLSMKLYDRTGRIMKTIVKNKEFSTGTHTLKIPSDVPSGIYFLRLSGDHLTETDKLIILK